MFGLRIVRSEYVSDLEKRVEAYERRIDKSNVFIGKVKTKIDTLTNNSKKLTKTEIVNELRNLMKGLR